MIRVGRALEPFDLLWLEVDLYDPGALAHVRRSLPMPVCSGENLYTARGFRPYLEAGALDVASVDVIWNGFHQAKKIADMAETYEVSCAPHNYYSHLATAIAAQWCAAIPNVRILELDVDDVPWRDELAGGWAPELRDGEVASRRARAGASRSTRTCSAPIRGRRRDRRLRPPLLRRTRRPDPPLRRSGRAARARARPAQSVVDLGCGVGTWLAAFARRGDRGLPRRRRRLGAARQASRSRRDRFLTSRLDRALRSTARFDLAVSLEVGEHLPEHAADALVETPRRAWRRACCSPAAVPSQGGTNHVNEQWPDYWAERFATRGYVVVDAIRPRIWSNRSVAFWYRQNALLFARPEAISANPSRTRGATDACAMLAVVHPELLDRVAATRPMLTFAA